MKFTECGKMTNCETLIVGGGIAGLSLSCEMNKLGKDNLCLEASSVPGGLCRSFKDKDGFYHDYGPHIFHNTEGFDWFREYVPDCRELPRVDIVSFVSGREVDYPVQTSCSDMINPDLSIDPNNYGEYCRRTYGTELSSQFFFPYNEKLFGTHITNISKVIAGRTPIVGQNRGTYLYPNGGKFSKLVSALSNKASMLCGYPVEYIDLKSKTVYSSSKSFSFENLIWCAPIDILASTLNINIPDLVYVNLLLVNRKIDKSEGYLAKYLAGKELAHRISCESVVKGHPLIQEFLQEEINSKQVRDIHSYENSIIIPRAYPIPTNRWIRVQKELEQHINDLGIILHGRAAKGVHMNIWPIVLESKRLAGGI